MDAAGAGGRDLDGPFGDRRDALAIDVLHREDVHAGGANLPLFVLVQIPDPDEHGVLRPDAWRAAIVASSRGSWPSRAASGMPWTFPDDVVCGVFMSPCASTQINPSG